MAQEKNLVIGGGIIGLCCALELQRRGKPVFLIDPQLQPPPASFGNAGHIAIEQVEPLASRATLRSAVRRLTLFGGPLSLPLRQMGRWLPFGMKLAQAARPDRFAAGKLALGQLLAGAMPAWQRLCADHDMKDLLLQSGHAVVWHNAHAAERGIAAWQRADTGTARFHKASQQELDWLASVMAQRPAAAIVFENTGQVADPGKVLAALGNALCAAGGQIRRDLVRAISLSGNMARVILDSGETLEGENIVLAAGVKSAELVAPLGEAAPVIAERGYHIQTPHHDWPDDMPPVVFEERSMIVTRFDSGLRAAGFVEFGHVDALPDTRKWRILQQHAASLGLPAQAPWQKWVGARPTLPDYLPAIGRVRAVSNLFYAFGHQHLGLTLGPVTGALVAALVQGTQPPPALDGFSLARFD